MAWIPPNASFGFQPLCIHPGLNCQFQYKIWMIHVWDLYKGEWIKFSFLLSYQIVGPYKH